MSTAVTEPSAATTQDQHQLECMEIWGGNRAANESISVPGIDAWIYSEPFAGDEHGGDIHYASMCGSGRIARFAVADVSGHGRAVGDLATSLRALMRKNINRVDQTRFARALNREFASLSSDGAFATAVLSTYFAPTDQLILVNAGHPPPLWYRAEQATWQYLQHDCPECVEASNLPLGVIEPTEYSQFVVELGKGDLVLLYTDSLNEASDEQGRQLGQAGLLELIGRLPVDRPPRFCKQVTEALAGYRKGRPADDDITLFLLHHNAANPPLPSVGEMARTIGKMLGLIKV